MPAESRVPLYMAAQLAARRERAEREARLLELSRRQHGVVALAQLRDLGFSGAGVRARVAAGRLHRVHRGVFSVGRPDLPLEGRWGAALLACGREAVLSHVSAAALHGLLSSAGGAVHVTVARGAGLSRPGIRIHRSTCLSDADRAVVRAIPCTSVARTLLDLAAVVPRRVLERACDQAEILRLLDWSAVDELLVRSRGRSGVRRLRDVLDGAAIGADVPRSELERRFLALCRRAGLPHPAVNEWLAVAGEEIQVDFVWHRSRVIVETDGFRTHGTRQAFRRDRRRDRLLGLAGWRVARFTWEDVTGDPEHVTGVLRSLFGTPTVAT